MRTIKLYFVVLAVLLNASVICWCQENGNDKNNYGIVAGQILDPETGKPVKERFDIRFFDTTYQGKYPSPTI
jgi:hypothetical protein